MQVLVTGSRGFIGRNVTRTLRERNHHVVELDHTLGHDVTKPLFSDDLDIIIHLAAVLGTQSDRFLNYLFQINVRGTLRMLEEAIDHKVPRFIFMSSAAVYHHSNQYGASKLAGEAYCQAASGRISTKIVRLFNAYGPGQASKGGALVPRVIEALFRGEPITIRGDGKQTRDFVFIEDIVNVLCYEVENNNLPEAEPIDLATGMETSVEDVVSVLQGNFASVMKREPTSATVNVVLDNPNEPRYSKAGVNGTEVLPQETIPLAQGLERTVTFWRDYVFRTRPDA